MHELSIIASIVDIAQGEVSKAGAHQVESIELEIGELAGVEWRALEFAWEVGVKQSVLETAEMHLLRIPGQARCTECGCLFSMKNMFDPCPDCGSYFNEITKGKELRVRALTVT